MADSIANPIINSPYEAPQRHFEIGTAGTPVETTKHGDTRTNIRTADALVFVDPSVEGVRPVRYARDESLDPQLVWRRKYDDSARIVETPAARRGVERARGRSPAEAADLVADAFPIYIQEKIDPRALVENLRELHYLVAPSSEMR